MNSFSKIIFLLLLSFPVFGITVDSYLLSNCTQARGFVLNVDRTNVYLLNLKGEIQKLPRYTLLAYASYQIEDVPLLKISSEFKAPFYKFYKNFHGENQLIAQGWALDFSNKAISVLTTEGEEFLVFRDDIEKIEVERKKMSHSFPEKKIIFKEDNLEDPFDNAACSSEEVEKKKIMGDIKPQEFTTDTIQLKKRLEAYQEGHLKLKRYYKDQIFYPKAQVYRNAVNLGLWVFPNSRHGTSEGRPGGIAPLIRNEYSSGPFSYQHIFTTGSGPIEGSIHTEAQTHIYYRLKADYIRAGFFIDPAIVLAGSSYNWKSSELKKNDVRFSEVFYMSLGFEISKFQIYANLASAVRIAYLTNSYDTIDAELNRIGFRYTNHRTWIDGQWGEGASKEFKNSYESELDLNFKRFEVGHKFPPNFSVSFIYIQLSGKIDQNNYDDMWVLVNEMYSFVDTSYTLNSSYNFSSRYTGSFQVSYETLDISQDADQTTSFFKAGAMLGLNF